MRIYTINLIIFRDTLRKGLQPSLWLPFIGIFSPNRLVVIRPEDADKYVGASGDRDFV